MEKIIVKNTCIEIPNYIFGDCPKLEKSLSIWDDRKHRYMAIGYDYSESTDTLYIPRGLDIEYVAKILNRVIEYDRDNKFRPNIANISLLTKPRDMDQVKGIRFLSGECEYDYTKNFSQKVLTLPPGIGKTYITIASLSILRERAVIITHLDRIGSQWIESMKNFTKIDENDIYDIKGSKDIDKLFKKYEENNSLPYKLYFINHGTIHSYCSKNGWDKIDDLFRVMGVGIKVYDEAHLNFSNILLTDFHSNVKRTFYLTATFRRSDPKQQKVFDLAFKNVIKFGIEKISEQRKHLNYLVYKFNTHPSMGDQLSLKSKRGFKVLAYFSYVIKKNNFYAGIEYLINSFIKLEGKILVLVGTIEACEFLYDKFCDEFSNKKVTKVHSKAKVDRVEAFNGDLIVSTPQSFGTGVDVDNIRVCINTVPYSSTVTADQVSGRLRPINDIDNSVYIEMVDVGFDQVNKMYKKRKKFLIDKCDKSFIIKERVLYK